MSKSESKSKGGGGKGGGSSPTATKDKKQVGAPTIIKAPSEKNVKGKESAASAAAAKGRKNTPGNEKKKDSDSSNAPIKKKGAGGGGAAEKNAAKRKTKKKLRQKQGGCCASLCQMLGIGGGNIALTDSHAIEAAQALDLQPWHLRRLKQRFDKIDVDGSGNIDATEFFESVGEQRSPFTDKLFALIDLDGSGTIEFDEYIRVMATYCMFTKDEILRFCFECFDVDGSGTIDEKEFMELCKTVNNAAPTFPGNFRRALEEFDVNEDGLIDYGEFMEIDRRYPLVLFPAFRLQDTMQRNSLGESAWLKVIEGYNEQKKIEEYKASHGGRLPPDPPLKMLGKLFFPCMYRERQHIKAGGEMETRQRSERK